MILALAITVLLVLAVWLVFFKFKWLKWSIAWAVVVSFGGLHVLLVFMIGLRFFTPYSTDGKIIQPTIQLVPRLSEPTLVTAVLVEPNAPVKKGQPLFQFDRRPYAYKVAQLEAELAKAKQEVHILGADIAVNAQKVEQAKAEVEYALYQEKLDHAAVQDRRRPGRGGAEVVGAGEDEGGARSRRRRRRWSAPGSASSRRSAASTRPWPRCRASSTRRGTTSTTPRWSRPRTARS